MQRPQHPRTIAEAIEAAQQQHPPTPAQPPAPGQERVERPGANPPRPAREDDTSTPDAARGLERYHRED